MTRTYYDVLGVARDADGERVRAAYRERVKEVHPDVSDRPDAAEQFRTLSAAREVLCDPDERARYDRLGHDAYVGESTEPHANSTPPSDDERDGRDRDTAGADANDEHDRTERDGAADSGRERTEWENRRRRNRRRADAWASGRDATWSDGQQRTRTEQNATAGGASASSGPSAQRAAQAGYVGPDETSWYRTGAGDATGYRVSTRSESAVRFTAERGLLAVAVFICYPMLLGVAVLPMFGPLVRVAAAVCALLVVAQTLSIPESGVLVFGALTLTAPIGLNLIGIDILSPEAVLAWAFCWIPFVIAVGNFLALRG